MSIRRQVAPARSAAYADAWHHLHALATARGAHAWRFRAAECDGLFLEFLEFGAERDLRADAEVRDAIQALHAESAMPSHRHRRSKSGSSSPPRP